MTRKEIERLQFLEKEIRQMLVDEGLQLPPEVIFEVVPAKRVIEGMAYHLPVNFSHWSFGRDYEKYSTIYRYTHQNIPYEVVWNFDTPKALLVESNPFPLNALIIAHVFGHVDFFMANRYLQRGREFCNLADQARGAAERFRVYEEKFGREEVERVIDAGLSLQWQLHPDPFYDEPDEENLRRGLMAFEQQKLLFLRQSVTHKNVNAEEIKTVEQRLERLKHQTPPRPTYDLLDYIIKHSPKPLEPWAQDVLGVIRTQARSLLGNIKTKMLDEGWASYWHVRMMHRLLREKLITPEEYGVCVTFHSGVTAEHKTDFNVYRIGLALFEYVKDKYDKGRFGADYDNCENLHQRANWDTKAMAGREKIFTVRSAYTDRLAIEELFTDEFINLQRLYIYERDEDADNVTYRIVENDPFIIREILKRNFANPPAPPVVIEDGNFDNQRLLFLKHHFDHYELDPTYRDLTLMKIFHLWGRRVHLDTVVDGRPSVVVYDGHKHSKHPKS